MLFLSSLYGNMKKTKKPPNISIGQEKSFWRCFMDRSIFFNSCKTDHLDIYINYFKTCVEGGRH